MSCDWCEGGACDLVIGDNISADIDEETGVLTVYLRGEEVGSRHVKYCPMCGKRIGTPSILEVPKNSFFWLFKKYLKKIFNPLTFDEETLVELSGTGGWNEALRKTCDGMNMQNWYKSYSELDWIDSDHYNKMFAEKVLEVKLNV